MNRYYKSGLLATVLICSSLISYATETDTVYTSTQQQAIVYIDQFNRVEASKSWPSVKPHLFLQNLKINIHNTLSFYPGRSTNFCGYGALSYLMIKQDPLGYAQFMMELYKNGKARYRNTEFIASPEIRAAAGTLQFKGVLDVRHAEQIWYLVLADHYKGYLNIFNRRYKTGDENTFWAATNYAKFNRMVKKMLGYRVHAVGGDLIRPWLNNTFEYISSRMNKGIVVLYLNNRIIHKKNHAKVKLSFPTHFVILEDIKQTGNLITLTYWDYGSRTLLQVTPSNLKRLIYGVSTCTKNGKNE